MQVKYDKIGVDYNITRQADPYLSSQLLKYLQPHKNGTYLDIGCGTGNYTNALQRKGYQFIGVDPSKEMLDKAQRKNSNIDWRIGTAENIPLSENSVDGIIASLTIHHWSDLQSGFSELYRVLKPNGRIVVFTSTPKQMKGYWLNHYFPKMLADSISQMPSLESVESACKASGIQLIEKVKYFIRPDLQDQFLYCGKQNPELYFDENIRHGISSFSSLANKKEVDEGLLMLRKDIDNGNIKELMKSYENDMGDYLSLIGKKLSE